MFNLVNMIEPVMLSKARSHQKEEDELMKPDPFGPILDNNQLVQIDGSKLIKLEQKIANLFGCQMACLYSHGFSTIATAIPVYAKPGDVVFADEASNFAIQKGLDASRCKVRYFKHNNIAHLIDLLEKQAKEDEENPTKANKLLFFIHFMK